MFESIETSHYYLNKWGKEKDTYFLYFKRKNFFWKNQIYIRIEESVHGGHILRVVTTNRTKREVEHTHKLIDQLEVFFKKTHHTKMSYVLGAEWDVQIMDLSF